MKIFTIPALLALCLPFATARPCLSQSDVNTLTTHFGDLVSAYSQKLANQTLTVDFVDYSESIITLMDGAGTTPKALLGMAFTSRANFEAQSSAQPSVPFQVQNTWYNCDTITIRWLSAQSPQPVSKTGSMDWSSGKSVADVVVGRSWVSACCTRSTGQDGETRRTSRSTRCGLSEWHYIPTVNLIDADGVVWCKI